MSLRFHAPDYARFRRGAFERKPTSALRQGSLKLVYDHESASAALYDLATDVSEARDLAVTRPQQAAALERALLTWLRGAPQLQPRPRTKAPR